MGYNRLSAFPFVANLGIPPMERKSRQIRDVLSGHMWKLLNLTLLSDETFLIMSNVWLHIMSVRLLNRTSVYMPWGTILATGASEQYKIRLLFLLM